MSSDSTQLSEATPSRPHWVRARGLLGRELAPLSPSRPIAILHVLGRMGRGGAEMRTLDILRQVDPRRFRLDFCALSGLPGELDPEVRALDGQVHLLCHSRIGFARRFRELLRREQYDVVHSHLQFYSGYVLRLAAECAAPMRIAHFRSSHDERASTPLRRLARLALWPFVGRLAPRLVLRRWLNRSATHILGVSRWALRSTWGPRWHADPRCAVVYDGIDPEPFAVPADRAGVRREFGLPEDAPLYIHVGRMAQAKNHVRLVKVFSAVLQRQPAARLLLVGRSTVGRGDDSIRRRLQRRIAELRIEGRVVFAGERGDVPRLLKAADALIFPSLWEGLGDVVLEAAAAGTPVVASDLPSIREMAGRLPGIHCLALQQPDAAWAEAAVNLAARSPSDSQRAAAWQAFARSTFTAGRCAETLCRLWQGERPACPQGEQQYA